MSPQTLAHQAYSQALHTVGKTRQVVMLYDGIIRFLRQAQEAIEQKRIEDRFNLLVRASDVVLGLQACLDFDSGGQVARTLYDFYSSVDSRILTIQRTNDLGLCEELIKELKEMRDAWSAIDTAEPEPAPHPAPIATEGSFSALGAGAAIPAADTQPQAHFSSDITV